MFEKWFDTALVWGKKISLTSPSDVIRSVILVVLVMSVHAIILRIVARHKSFNLETKRRVALILRNTALIIALVGLIVIWSSEIRTLALSMVAVAVALAVAFKELITCLVASLWRTVSNCYALGDYVEVGAFKGRVVDIDLTSTTLMEMGPRNVFQFTGRAVIFPNSYIFITPVVRLDYTGKYVAHTVQIPVPFDFPLAPSQELLMRVAHEICQQYLEPARSYMARMEARDLVDTPSVEPRFAIVPVDEKGYKLILRVVVPQSEQHDTEQLILHRFFSEVPRILGKIPPPQTALPIPSEESNAASIPSSPSTDTSKV